MALLITDLAMGGIFQCGSKAVIDLPKILIAGLFCGGFKQF
jgi:hypothetical protein